MGKSLPHPAVFLLMYLPFGIASGYFSVTLGYLLAHAGVSTAVVASVVAILTWLQVGKIVWAPVVDSVWSYRGFYGAACLTLAVCVAGSGFVAGVGALSGLAVLIGLAMGLIGVTTNGIMARSSPAGQRGRAGGWSTAGNLGGVGVGGGLGLWIATHSGVAWLSAVVLGGLCACGVFALGFVGEPVHVHRAGALSGTLRNLSGEVWRLVRSRPGALGLLIMVLPMGTGSAANLFSAVAGDWGASAGLVALVTGVFSGVVAAGGCLVGGYVCDVIDRRGGYLLAGFAMAVCAVGLVVLPKTPVVFAALTLVYACIGWMAYGACYAVVLDAAAEGGGGGEQMRCAHQFEQCADCSDDDDRWLAQTRFGTDGMLLVESGAGVLAIGVYFGVAFGTKEQKFFGSFFQKRTTYL